MKNFIFKLLFCALALIATASISFAQSTSPKFGTAKNQDNTGRVLTYSYKVQTYAATDSVKPSAFDNTFKTTLTGAQTLKADVTKGSVCDKMVLIYNATGAARTVTFSTGLVVSASTLVVDSAQKATISFIHDGVNWVETARAKQ